MVKEYIVTKKLVLSYIPVVHRRPNIRIFDVILTNKTSFQRNFRRHVPTGIIKIKYLFFQ